MVLYPLEAPSPMSGVRPQPAEGARGRLRCCGAAAAVCIRPEGAARALVMSRVVVRREAVVIAVD